MNIDWGAISKVHPSFPISGRRDETSEDFGALRTQGSRRIGIVRHRLAWAHNLDVNPSIAATFQTLPWAWFVVNGAVLAHESALSTASAEMRFITGISLAATFEDEFSKVTNSYAGKRVARYQWQANAMMSA